MNDEWYIGSPHVTGLCTERDPPVSSKDEPWCLGAIHCAEMVIKVLQLGRAVVKAVLSTHQNKVNTAKIKPKPASEDNERRYWKHNTLLMISPSCHLLSSPRLVLCRCGHWESLLVRYTTLSIGVCAIVVSTGEKWTKSQHIAIQNPLYPELGKSRSWFPMHTMYGRRVAIGCIWSKNSSHWKT